VAYVQIGALGSGTPGYFEQIPLDFAGLADGVHYIQVVREACGPKTGMFIDSFAGLGVPEPATIALVVSGGLPWMRRRRRAPTRFDPRRMAVRLASDGPAGLTPGPTGTAL